MPDEKSWAKAVQLDDYALVLGGGTDDCAYCRSVYAFDTVQEVWAEWLPIINADCAAASDGVRLFVAGGFSTPKNIPVSDVYELNKKRDGWLKLPSMPKAYGSPSATIMKNKLYVMGNDKSYVPYRTIVQVMSLEDGSWSEITLLSTIPDRVSSIFRKHCLAAFRDFIISDQLVAYDTSSGRSKDLPSPPGSELDAIQTLAVIAGRLLAFGEAEHPSSKKVHMLSSDHERWEELPSMTTARSAPASCTVNGVLYVFGGYDASFSSLRTVECFK